MCIILLLPNKKKLHFSHQPKTTHPIEATFFVAVGPDWFIRWTEAMMSMSMDGALKKVYLGAIVVGFRERCFFMSCHFENIPLKIGEMFQFD